MVEVFQTSARCPLCGTGLEGKIVPLTEGRHTGDVLWKQAQIWCPFCSWFTIDDYNGSSDEDIIRDWNRHDR